MATKYSRQREEIKAYLCSRTDHPTADNVYTAIRKKLPNISLGTVYRNLTLLAEQGEIVRLHLGDGIDHFDHDTSLHYHFVCKQCGSITDFPLAYGNFPSDISDADFTGKIEGHVTYFYGTCAHCLQNTTQKGLTL
ncbi:MAG: transcriptional repressor [Lachnospiraceae bacterium]|nr:transcriptional repressor [Lachnospiraceae bacterium]